MFEFAFITFIRFFIITSYFSLSCFMYGEPIDDNEEHFVKKILFGVTENIAITNDCKKIQLDTHQSLKFYNNDGLKE